MKKKLALFLAFIILLGIVPMDVFAANTAKSELANDKAYEEVRIDGVPYKVYKVADFIDGHSEESAISLMSRSAKPFGNPTPTGTSNIKFVLNLKWSTVDRPIENIKLPVYVGPPNDSQSFTLGYFEVKSYAHPGIEQRFDMVKTYTGNDIDDLIKYAFSQITIAIPADMRYDFILASVKWDGKQKPVNNEFVFTIEGKQSVMHGYGIKWYDIDAANRDKVEARWEGLANQISDVKLGTEDRNYSAYVKNTVNPQENINTYPDGTQYSKYDYYYNGKKITTYADADNTGKYNSDDLAIAIKENASDASLKVKDGTDYKLKGSKVLKNDTKYFYNSVGDYRTFHVLSMREAVNVKFNTGLGFLNDTDKTNDNKEQTIKVTVNNEEKESQEIGYGEKLAGNESGNVVIIPDGKKLIAPEKINNKKDNYEFKGWVLSDNKDKTYEEVKKDKAIIYPDEGNDLKDKTLKPAKEAFETAKTELKSKKAELDKAYDDAANKYSVYLKAEEAIKKAKKADPNADVTNLEKTRDDAKAEYDQVKKVWDDKKEAYNTAKTTYDTKLDALEKEAKDTISYQVLNKKETTFYAVFGPKDQGKVNVKYVDENGNAIISTEQDAKDYRFISKKDGVDEVTENGVNRKLTIAEKYPASMSDTLGKKVLAPTYDSDGKETKATDNETDPNKKSYIATRDNAPKFIGYEVKKVEVETKTGAIQDYKPQFGPTKDDQGQDITEANKFDTVKYVYKKLDPIIPEKKNGQDNPDVTQDIKDTYVKVTFTNGLTDKKFGKLYLGDTEPTEKNKLIESVSYYVNPREKKTIDDVRTTGEVNVKVSDVSKKVHATTPWIDNNSNKIELTKEITDADKKDGITVNANYDDKGNGVAIIRYVVKDSSGTKTTIDAKYQAVADTDKYPATIQGTLGTNVIDYADKTKNDKFEAPKFVGYTYKSPELLDQNKSKFVEDTSNDKATLDLVYTKEAEIIEKKDGTTIPEGYKDITFKNAIDNNKTVSKLNNEQKDIVYSINPKAGVKIVKDNSDKYQLVGKDAKGEELKKPVPAVTIAEDGYKVVDHKDGENATGWNYDKYDDFVKSGTAITENTEFTAKVEQKGNGTAKLAYVDDNNATLDPVNTAKLQVAGETYNPSLSGKDGTPLPSYTAQNAPKLLGYVFVSEDTKVIENTTTAVTNYKEDKVAVITLKYKKLDDVYKGKKEGNEDKPDVPGNDPKKDDVINTVKETYVKVKFLADEATRISDDDTNKDKDTYRRGKLNSTENEVFYYINPKAQNTLGAFIATTETDGKFVVPTINPKEGYKKATQEWNPDLATKKSQAVDANNKELTFIAQYAQKGTGYVKVEYWADGTKLDSIDAYKLPGKTYITSKQGKEDTEVHATDLTNDYHDLLGYEKDTTQGIEIPANAKYETETANIKTVKFHYKKIDDIVGPAVPGTTKPAGYVTIMFKADADNQNPARGNFGTNIQEVVYYVNPKTVTIDMSGQKLSGKNKDDQAINKDFPTLTVTDNNFVANKHNAQGNYDANGTQQWLVKPDNGIVNNKLAQTITENDTLTLTAMYLGKFNVTYKVVIIPQGKELPKPLDDATKAVTKDLKDKTGKDALKPGTKVDNPAEIDLSKLSEEDKKLVGNEVGQWSVSKWVKTQDNSGNITFTLTWTFTEAGKPYEYLTLTLDENYRGGRISDYDAYQGALIEGYLYRPHRRGYVFEGWSYNSRRLDEVRPGDRIEYSTILYAIWSKQKPKDDEEVEPIDTREVGEHKAYMFGYTDGTVRPNGYITRAEAAALVTRLLGLDTFASAAEPAFTDTPSSWYNKAINAAVNRGIMKGYPDKSFRPNAPITRAEFTQMISTIDNKPYGVAPFADVVGHWAERPIGSEYQAGRIKGYPDGTFRPNAFITRAEAVVILNKIFERNYDAMSAMNAKNKEYIKRFIDLAPSFWGFNDMVEATNTHLFKRRVKGAVQEDWVEVK